MLQGSALQIGFLGLLIGGLGMGIGGILAFIIGNVKLKVLPAIVSGAIGMIFSIIILDLFPESVEVGGVWMTIAGIILGLILSQKMDRFHRIVFISNYTSNEYYIRSGLLLAFAVALHNFPAGMAFGASSLGSPSLALNLGLMMVIHSIPEGLTITLPFVLGGFTPTSILPTMLIVAIPTGLGAYIGYLMGLILPWGLSILLGIAIGTIVFVTFVEILIPTWRKHGIYRGAIGFAVGYIIGLLFLNLT